jgi:hypothetical protein
MGLFRYTNFFSVRGAARLGGALMISLHDMRALRWPPLAGGPALNEA